MKPDNALQPPEYAAGFVHASGFSDCLKSEVVPGSFELELEGMPPDAYISSATASGQNILTEGLNISGDTGMDITLSSTGGIVEGVVRYGGNETLPDAVVVLVPDA